MARVEVDRHHWRRRRRVRTLCHFFFLLPCWLLVLTESPLDEQFSILLSIRAFLKSREKKDKENRDSADPPMLQKDVDTLQVTPSREYKHEPLAMPVPYKRDSDIDYLPPPHGQPQQQPAAQKDHREFAL